ncbi:MAG: MBL fold metallo-hydrolase [Acidimicrobiia bacterium]
MARLSDRNPASVDGRWFVDRRCIDCDVARQHAPDLIGALPDGLSVVVRQPSTPDEELLMWRAALACPTLSIGTTDRAQPPTGVYPWELTPGVSLLGHNDRTSFGAHSWYVPRPGGGVMIDAPHWANELVDAIEKLGGLHHVLLTHRDDIADAERYADRFGASVVIHEDDRSAAPFATSLIVGEGEQTIADGVIAIPVPGHTRGSVVYMIDQRWLFTGDTLAWFPKQSRLGAFRDATWYSWDVLRNSLERLAASGHRFEWVLPGHGKWHGATAEEMHQHLVDLVAGM